MESKQSSPTARPIPPSRSCTRKDWDRPQLAAPVDVLSGRLGGVMPISMRYGDKNGIVSQLRNILSVASTIMRYWEAS